MHGDGAALDARLRRLFLTELGDGLLVLEQALARLQAGAAGDEAHELVVESFRTAHSLKGAAHSVGRGDAVRLCDELETIFAAGRTDPASVTGPGTDRIAGLLDALRVLRRRLEDEQQPLQPGAPRPTAEPDVRVAVSTTDLIDTHVSELVDVLTRRGLNDRELLAATTPLVELAQQLRLQRFDQACAGLAEAAREVAEGTGKRVELVVEGADTELDRLLVSALREPLLHLVRNAVGHGIEAPARRIEARKPQIGVVRVSAELVDGAVEVTVADDGAGVDVAALQAAASASSLPLPEEPLQLMFTPGVTTAGEVTAVSGRGVGMDAVRDRIERLGGSCHVRTGAGEGTAIVLRAPSRLATLRVLLVRVGSQRVAFPVTAIDGVEAVRADDLRTLGGQRYRVGGAEPTVVVSAAAAMHAEPRSPATERITLVRLIGDTGHTGALAVDAVETELTCVLKPAPARLSAAAGLLGVVSLPGGETVIAMNPLVVYRAGTAIAAPPVPAASTRAAGHTVLLADDTLTTRALERSILESAGYRVLVAADGSQAWQMLRDADADADVDLVVSDVDMPGMDGIALCRAIRATPRLSGLPVVLVTGLGSDEDRARGADAGADAYLVKSAFDREVLLDTVARLL